MARYVYRNGEVVDAETAGPKNASSTATHVISDTMDPTKHMANGKMYDSKSEFRKATRAAGCVEVGNEMSTVTAPRKRIELSREQRRNEIRKSISQLR